MFGSSVDSFWIPNYDSGLRLGDVPRKSSGITRGFRHTDSMPALTVSRDSRKRITAERRYVAAALAGLTFDDDVIREHCFLVDSQSKTCRHHARRQASKRHRNDISYLKKPVDHFRYLKPLKTVKPSCEKVECVAGSGTANGSGLVDVLRHSSKKLNFQCRKCSTGVDDIASGEEESVAAWDEYVVMKLSANTARWLAQNPATTEDTRNRLHNTLNAVHGRATDDPVELVAENVTEADDVDVNTKTVKKPWLSGKDM